MITLDNYEGETKKSWVGFYNEEAEQAVQEYLKAKKPSRSQRLFPMQRDEVVELWKSAREKTRVDITPQKLRQWFCSEMLRLAVSETHVDVFCGRVPRSVSQDTIPISHPRNWERLTRRVVSKYRHSASASGALSFRTIF